MPYYDRDSRLTNNEIAPTDNNVNRVPISFNQPNRNPVPVGFDFSKPQNTNIQTGRFGMQNDDRIKRNLFDTNVVAPSLIPQSQFDNHQKPIVGQQETKINMFWRIHTTVWCCSTNQATIYLE